MSLPTLDAFMPAAQEAALGAMRIVMAYQQGERTVSESRVKAADASLVTNVDHACEAAVVGILRSALPNVPILGEEGGWTGELSEAPYFITIDPIDGTRAFATGVATSTTMIALYDSTAHQLVGAVIGHAATGRIWAAGDSGCRRLVYGRNLDDAPVNITQCRPWTGELSKSSTLLIDKFRPYKAHAGTKQVQTTPGCKQLHEALFDQVVIHNYGSNGFHQALVADGGYSGDKRIGVAASLMTGMGGWWDCAGALLVVRAGGAARGFYVNGERKLEVRDPLDPMSYDMLLIANNEATLERLSEVIVRTFA